jgi:hypothetical protein
MIVLILCIYYFSSGVLDLRRNDDFIFDYFWRLFSIYLFIYIFMNYIDYIIYLIIIY